MCGGRRALSWFGVLAAVQMIVVSTVDGLTRPGYDELRNWVSQLALGPDGWRGTANLALCGLWLVLCGLGLSRRPVVWCGLLLVALAVVRTDAGLGFPPGVAEEHTTRGLIHQSIAVALAVVALVAVRNRLVAAVMAVSFTAATVLVLLDAWGVLPGTPSGLLERIALFTGFGWIGLVSGRAAWDSSGRRRRAERSTAGADPGRTPGAASGTAGTESGR
ncbi:DUF998 domain-containing protein [Actinoplanes sp. G11-F43]|uniref:DUF998 domain-containing protein n=1 Tax=Actinoplanes sp. G11-F43 TaxID=3424130 RepID=UPI003D3347DF